MHSRMCPDKLLQIVLKDVALDVIGKGPGFWRTDLIRKNDVQVKASMDQAEFDTILRPCPGAVKHWQNWNNLIASDYA